MIIQLLCLAGTGYFIWRGYKMTRAASTDGPSDVCISCNSRELEPLAPQAYRCSTCGYEGGPGFAAHVRRNKAQAISQLNPELRRERARKLLIDADLELLAGIRDLERASTHSAIDMLDLNIEARGSGNNKFDTLAAATRRVLEARAAVQEAEMHLGMSLGAGPDVAVPDALEGAADVWVDHIAFDVNTHLHIGNLIEQARALHAQVRYALQQHFGPSTEPYRSTTG